jgi:hypothetical protein
MVPQPGVPNVFRNSCEGVIVSPPDYALTQEIEILCIVIFLCRDLTVYQCKAEYNFTDGFGDGVESSFEF